MYNGGGRMDGEVYIYFCPIMVSAGFVAPPPPSRALNAPTPAFYEYRQPLWVRKCIPCAMIAWILHDGCWLAWPRLYCIYRGDSCVTSACVPTNECIGPC